MAATTEHIVATASATDIAATAFDVLAAYLMDLDASERTRDSYHKALRQYVSWLNNQDVTLDHTTRAHVLAYKRYLEETKSAATTNAYLVALRSLYTWLNGCTGYPNVAKGVKGVRTNNQSSKDALTAAQACDIIEAPAEGVRGLRDHAMLTLMVRRGLRTIEVSRADVGDVRPVNGVMCLYVQGKGHTSKDDFVVLGDECERAIRSYLKARREDGGDTSDGQPLFAATGNRNRGGRMTTRAISRIAKEAMRKQGIDSPRLTAHSLRHTCVTLALAGGATVQEAQAMARHTSVNVTMRYAHNLNRTEARAERSVDAVLARAACVAC